jgi:hypothetical protein
MPDKALELRAAAVVASILDARFISRDVGGTQLRDFDLLFADGHAEPLEITEASIRSIRNTAGRLERKDREAASLRRDWQVEMPSNPRVGWRELDRCTSRGRIVPGRRGLRHTQQHRLARLVSMRISGTAHP